MPKLKKYETHQKKTVSEPEKPKKSGVACTEKKCKGEMMIWEPKQKHPEYPKLHRASCSVCGWKGWV